MDHESRTERVGRTPGPSPSEARVVVFRFASQGPWGRELADASLQLARDIAGEPGLVWKIWLEDRGARCAGGVYLFDDAAAAERYREKHERRLSAMGFEGITAQTFSVNTELSVLTLAGAALGRPEFGAPSEPPPWDAPAARDAL